MNRSPRTVAGRVLLGVALALAGCSDPATTTSAATTIPAATASSSPNSANAQPSRPSVAPTGSAAVPEATTVRTSPAPSTAGELSAADFPSQILRWRPVAGEGDEDTYQPNGTWVHALDPQETATNLQLQACGEAKRLPVPGAVLASDYKDPSGARAIGQLLSFDSPATARSFAQNYRANVETCRTPGGLFTATVVSTDPFTARRVLVT
ncbi:hypothetical protein, partial [Luteococcus sp.]|uniref:hypothetical protein n=1 Tax=Luteococcus sp. TaxID=1969402 RepID=UPI0037360001